MRLTLIALFALAACSGEPATADRNAATESANATVRDDPSPAPVERATPGAASTAATPAATKPNPAPTEIVSEAPFTEDSAQGAANVVQTYYALIGEGKYGQAYALWGEGAAGMSREAFAASFGRYRDYHAEIGAPSGIEGAAGSRYVTVPVRAYGTLRSGQPFNMRGSLTMRRAAVDGATAAQRRWHIASSDIKPRPDGSQPAPGGTVDNLSEARFRCMDGVRTVARFDPDNRRAMLVRAGKTIVLAQERSGSGIRYSDGRTVFAGKGRNMTFEAPGQPPVACTVIGR